MKIIDIHTHVYPDAIAQKAADSIGQFYDMPVRRNGTLDCLLREGEQISLRMICSVAVSPSRVEAINDYLSATVAAHPGQVKAFGAMHPDFPGVERELDRIQELGFYGIKLHPDIQRFPLDSPSSVSLLKKAAERGLPALLHTGDSRFDFSGPERVARLLDQVPDLQAICAHLGGWSEWEKASRLLAGRPEVWVDTSSSLYAFEPQAAADMIHCYSPERVLFGTDYPMWDTPGELERFFSLPLTEKEREKILHLNAEELLELKE